MENCRICNSDYIKSNHLNSDQHKNKTKQQREATQVWCEDCGKYISDKTRHFQSEIHTLRSQATRSTPALHTLFIGPWVEVIVNEKTYIKLKVNPTGVASQNLEKEINDLLSENYFPRYKYQLSYLAKFIKYGGAACEEILFQNGLSQILIIITLMRMCITH